MVQPTKEQIKDYASNPDVVLEHVALLKVGLDKGDTIHEVMKRVIAHILCHFHKIPLADPSKKLI